MKHNSLKTMPSILERMVNYSNLTEGAEIRTKSKKDDVS